MTEAASLAGWLRLVSEMEGSVLNGIDGAALEALSAMLTLRPFSKGEPIVAMEGLAYFVSPSHPPSPQPSP